MIFELEKVLSSMRTVREESTGEGNVETWQTHFEFTEARLKARIGGIYEYSYLLGQIRLDSCRALGKGDTGWRMGLGRISVTEPIAKRYARRWPRPGGTFQKNHPDTPVGGHRRPREQLGLGLEWRAMKE